MCCLLCNNLNQYVQKAKGKFQNKKNEIIDQIYIPNM
jgi:hypothetical protein